MLYNINIQLITISNENKGEIMQLAQDERNLVLKFLNIIYAEGKFDYSKYSDYSVLNINGTSNVLTYQILNKLKGIITKLEGDV